MCFTTNEAAGIPELNEQNIFHGTKLKKLNNHFKFFPQIYFETSAKIVICYCTTGSTKHSLHVCSLTTEFSQVIFIPGIHKKSTAIIRKTLSKELVFARCFRLN